MRASLSLNRIVLVLAACCLLATRCAAAGSDGEGGRQPFLDQKAFDRIVRMEMSSIRATLRDMDKYGPISGVARSTARRLKSPALLLAAAAQRYRGHLAASQLSAFRDAALKLALAARAYDLTAVTKQAALLRRFPQMQTPVPGAPQAVDLAGKFKIGDLMRTFALESRQGRRTEIELTTLARQAEPLSVKQMTPDLELQAYRVALVADLMRVSPTDEDGGWVPAADLPPRLWNEYADYMQESALQLVGAIKIKNTAKAALNIGRLSFTCNSCHERYWGDDAPFRSGDPPYSEKELLLTLQIGVNARRREAIAQTVQMNALSRALLRVLTDRLRHDPDATVRRGAVTALQKHGLRYPAVRRALVDALRDLSPEVSSAALAALRHPDSVALDTLDGMDDLLVGVPERVRWWLAVRVGPTADPSARLPVVLRDEGLKDADPAVRLAAATILGQLGPRARDAAAALSAALQDPHVEVREAAALALRQSANTDAIPGLLRSLHDPDPVVRGRVSIALSRVGKAAVAALICVLKDDDPDARATAISALGRIGPDAREAVPALRGVVKGADAYQAKLAALALKKIEANDAAGRRP